MLCWPTGIGSTIKIHFRKYVVGYLFVASIVAIAACQNRQDHAPVTTAAAKPAAALDGPGQQDSAPAAPGAVDGGQDAAADAIPAASGHVETTLYDLFFEGIRKCSATDSAANSTVWMGAAIRVRARVSELFITPQDFTLEQGGVIINARHVNTPTLPGCLPLLRPTQLRGKQSVNGYVLFEVPARFRNGSAPVTLAHRATRWGGAKRVVFVIPPCLDVCNDTVADEKTTKASRGRSRARRSER